MRRTIRQRVDVDASTPVLVLKPNASLAQHGTLGIARSLGRLGVPVYWAHGDSSPPAARSRYIRGTFPWTYDRTRPAEALERLLAIGAKLGRRTILVPSDDGTSVLVAENAGLLREHFIFPLQPAGLVRKLTNKWDMHCICTGLGMPVPRTMFPRSSDEVREFARESSFPIVLKRAAGWVPTRGNSRRSVVVANTLLELLTAYEELESPDEPNVLLQEHIPGGSESVWMFNGYFDESSECLVGYTGYKLRQNPPNTGPTTLGLCAWNSAVAETTQSLMRSIGYRGIVDMGYRFDARDGQYKLLDVNPRIGTSFRLFVGEGGIDVARAHYLDLTGQPVRPTRAMNGRKWIDEPLDLVSSFRSVRDGDISVETWFRSLRGVDETAWFSRDDPLPALAMWFRYLRVALGRRRRRADAPLDVGPVSDRQRVVSEHFDASVSAWDDIYSRTDVHAVIHQERRRRALEWIDDLALEPGSTVLEVGCGAGSTAVALAQKGLDVVATDASPRMLERARNKARDEGMAGRIHIQSADVHALQYGDNTFDLALALGVLPWLHSPAIALAELQRVLKPGGFLVVNADNRFRLTNLIDPRCNPWLARPRQGMKRFLTGRLGVQSRPQLVPPVTMYSRREFDLMLRSLGFESVSSAMLGFGPFTFWNRKLFRSREVELHRWLQREADRGVVGLRSTGAQYLVLVKKTRIRGTSRHKTPVTKKTA